MALQVCEACGCRFEFIKGPAGKPIPVQKVRTVYKLLELKEENGRLVKAEIAGVEGDGLYVSHFETCSHPGQFSRRRP
jgi:hypothetical protein